MRYHFVGMTVVIIIERRRPDGVVVVFRLLVHEAGETINVGEVLVGRIAVQTEGDRSLLVGLTFINDWPVRRDERAGIGRHTTNQGGEGQSEE